MKTYELSQISPAQAATILAMVPYRESLDMGQMRWPSGYTATPARSLQEVYYALNVGEKIVPTVNFANLVTWVDKAVGDKELAQAIETCISKPGNSYVEQCLELHEIVGTRLAQLREISGDKA